MSRARVRGDIPSARRTPRYPTTSPRVTRAGFVREDASERYLVAVNLTSDEQEGVAQDPLPSGGDAVFGAGTLEVSGGSLHVKLPAMGAAVFAIAGK